MATLPGVRLYEALGYRRGIPIDHELRPGITIRFVPMTRDATSGAAGDSSATYAT